jgi:3-methyladenine DNA glycosylase AlkD
MSKLEELIKRTKKLYSAERAEHSKYFFKTGPGQYGEGDVFWGLSVPEMRQIAKEYANLELKELEALIADKVHELRLIGLTILVEKYQKAKNDIERQKFYKFYLKNRAGINNWDLVDLSVYKLMGDYLVRFPKERIILDKLIKSKNIWDRRLAMVSTMAYIRNGESEIVAYLAEKLLNDSEDLMHKASGWMLRELGKRQKDKLLGFLDTHGVKMPRTMLRYAIEKLSEEERRHYLTSTKF